MENEPLDATPTIQTDMMSLTYDPFGREIYHMEYDEQYIGEKDKENIEKHSEEIKKGTEPYPLYIPLKQEKFLGTAVLFNEEGIPVHFLCGEEIDEIIRLREENKKLTIDPVTEVDNRVGWNIATERLADMIQRGEIDEKHITLAAFDLNNLKKINDELGHNKGDEYLLEMANHLKGVLRSYDEIARWGGDEFATFAMSNQNIVDTMERRLNKQRNSNLSYCAGIVSFSVKSVLEELEQKIGLDMKERKDIVLEIFKQKFNQADKLLYEAKEISLSEIKDGIKPTVIKKQITDTSV